jgi:hypothetical protein
MQTNSTRLSDPKIGREKSLGQGRVRLSRGGVPNTRKRRRVSRFQGQVGCRDFQASLLGISRWAMELGSVQRVEMRVAPLVAMAGG